jgi:hypothetical protein
MKKSLGCEAVRAEGGMVSVGVGDSGWYAPSV